ncbi:MAG: hypothetical protein DRP76_03245 [Candidatus Omnitrophota bacterium]|nr:MAG: hypothetical protein DRP76_03245 [Candidatus Omnitrophota bacterium]
MSWSLRTNFPRLLKPRTTPLPRPFRKRAGWFSVVRGKYRRAGLPAVRQVMKNLGLSNISYFAI